MMTSRSSSSSSIPPVGRYTSSSRNLDILTSPGLPSLVRALAYCHEKKVIHRDIKPENFLFDIEFASRMCVCPLLWYYAVFLYKFKYYNRDPGEHGGLACFVFADGKNVLVQALTIIARLENLWVRSSTFSRQSGSSDI